ncbi:MAG: ABC transporter ATP-binding protein [Deltaproteobacteria bacterium]|nr:ABC transporter ATP-binding protein [Deltaproteobacteria bacterium]
MRSLALSEISVRFGPVAALSGVSLQSQPGEVQLLAGPNGAGKSTLIGVLLGLVRPDAGQLLVDGEPTSPDPAFRARVGYMPESVAFAGNASGRDVLRFFARARGVALPRVDAVLDEVGLADAARRPVRGYSRGMRQRLGLGVAILHEPELLVLDEPTGGLDQDGLALLWRLFDRWRQAGRMIWVASHELGLVERRVDRVAVLRAGRLVAEGSPTALRERAGLAVRATFTLTNGVDDATAARYAGNLAASLAARATDVASLGALTAVLPVDRDNGQPRARVVAELEPTALAATLQRAARWSDQAEGSGIAGIRVEEPGLDQVYEALLAADAAGRDA